MRRRYYRDRHGVLRHRAGNRKVRSDYGMPKPHPHNCKHCEIVRAFREDRAVQLEAQGGWRNAESAVYTHTFFEFQAMWYAHEAARNREAA